MSVDDAGERLGEIAKWFDIIELGGLSDGSGASFDNVRVDFDASIVDEPSKSFLARDSARKIIGP